MKFNSDSLARIMLASAAMPMLLMRAAPPKNSDTHVDRSEQTVSLLGDIKSLTQIKHELIASSSRPVVLNQSAIQIALAQITSVTDANNHHEVLTLRWSDPVRVGGVAGEPGPEALTLSADPYGPNGSVITLSTDASLACDTPATLWVSGVIDPKFPPGVLPCTAGFELQGSHGEEAFVFLSGTFFSAIFSAINEVSKQTGVAAVHGEEVDPYGGFYLQSVETGMIHYVYVDYDFGHGPGYSCFNTYSYPGGPEDPFDRGEEAPMGDADCDGVVGAKDLAIVLGDWGECVFIDGLCFGDFNLDGVIGPQDLAILIGFWGSDGT